MKKDTEKLYDLPLGDLQEEPPHRVQRRKRSHKWLWLTLTVLVVLGAVAAAVLWDANSFDGLRRERRPLPQTGRKGKTLSHDFRDLPAFCWANPIDFPLRGML